MTIEELKNKRVAILGFGEKEGPATAEYLLKHGIKPVLLDGRSLSEHPENSQTFIKSHRLEGVFGPSYLIGLQNFNVIFRNPAVPFLTAKLQDALKSGVIVTSQTKWFFEHQPAKIIGVTGTKGKGTTSSLIYECLRKKYGEQARLTGNIGYEQPLDFLDELTAGDWIVYELSSFQLQDLDTSPHISVVLMITSDHLDHHQSVKEYHQAKQNIVRHQTGNDITIINADYEGSYAMRELGHGQKWIISKDVSKVTQGCVISDENINFKGMSSFDVAAETVLNLKELKLRGKHNLENISAGILASLAAGVPPASCLEAAKGFVGLEHRLEFVGAMRGISFYNDSISTVAETAAAAIKSFSEPLIVILGGSEKNSDYTELGQAVHNAKNIKAVILIGVTAPKVKQAIEQAGGNPGTYLEGAKSMREVFTQIKATATAGDVVLLSPAAASFDMFKNYKDRGEQFKDGVHKFYDET